ncbi:transposable element Tcb1 transposase [Trichonephila clavipes]|nr:transposable element Tcb1 transposase [Trichonephila clavipes]
MALHCIRALRNPTFQQDNARPHVTGIVRILLDTENIRLLPLPARSLNLSPIENVCYMVGERLAHTIDTTADELWDQYEAAWESVHIQAIQSIFHSIIRRISNVIVARGGCSEYLFFRCTQIS